MVVWVFRLFCKPVRPGAPIALGRKRAGEVRYATLGCLVRASRRRYILTCAHVFEGGRVGDEVRLYDTKRGRFARVVGRLSHLGKTGQIDCSLVAVAFSARVKPTFPSIGRISSAPLPMSELRLASGTSDVGRIQVQMIGARAGRRVRGYAAIGTFSPVRYPARSRSKGASHGRRSTYVLEPPFIEIRPNFEDGVDFCRRGDSGALILTVSDSGPARPLGLLVARRPPGAGGGIGGVGLAIPIGRALEEMGSSLKICTGSRRDA